jgi:hypothetical protein
MAFDDPEVEIVLADRDRVVAENLEVSAFAPVDLGKEKAAVLASRRRQGGLPSRVLHGELRYTVRPGLVRQLDAAVLCLDNPSAIHDAALVLWEAAPTSLPVFALTCGGADGGYQVRVFVQPGLCPVCLYGRHERDMDRLGLGVSCTDTSAPRASAAGAEGAARAGAALLGRWLGGEHGLANLRVQRDAGGAAYAIRMPDRVSPSCAVHAESAAVMNGGEQLGGPIAEVTLADLARRVMERVGGDAEIDLGRRATPLGGLYCSACRRLSPAPFTLLPAAAAAGRTCRCDAPLRPLGERHSLGAAELLEPSLARLTLEAWGAGHGDEIVACGSRGRARFRCDFEWRDVR